MAVGAFGLFANAEDFLVTDFHGHVIQRFESTYLTFVETFGTTGTMYPESIKMGLDGNFYVSGYYGPVYKFSPTGAPLGTVGPYIQRAVDVCADHAGNLYVMDYDLQGIRKITAAGNDLGLIASYPSGSAITIDSNEILYVGSIMNGVIKRFTTDGAPLSDFGLGSPRQFTIDPTGEFYFAQPQSGTIKRLSSTGQDLGTYLSVQHNAGGVVHLADDTLLVAESNDWVNHFAMDGTPLGHTYGGNIGYSFGLALAPPESVWATVNLQNYAAAGVPGTGVTVEIRPVGSTTPIEEGPATVNANGKFAFATSVVEGNYDIAVKGSHWLRQTLTDQAIGRAGISGLSYSLVNGDINGDNAVTLGDFAQMRAAFGSSPGDGNWNPNADLNGDGAVTLGDFAILRSHFGEQGDP